MASHSLLLSAFVAAITIALGVTALAQETVPEANPFPIFPPAAAPTINTAKPEAPKVVSPAANPANAALLALKSEQIALWEAEIRKLAPFAFPEYLQALDSDRERAKTIEMATGDAALDYAPFQERAYFAANDGSPQSYYVMLPEGYTPEKKWPLIMFLHGYSTVISKINPWIPLSEVLQAAATRGFIFAIPYGRRNSDFVDWGEDDVRAVRDEVMRHYSVDSTRVHLLGASMGAYGAYTMAMHRPGEWTSVAPISGRTDMFLWFKTTPEALPDWKRVLLQADDPRTLIANASQTPFYIQHGALDITVPVEHARRFMADATPLGLKATYYEAPLSGHEDLFQTPAYERAFDWFLNQSSAEPPRRFRFTTGNGLENRAYWARIETFEDYAKPAKLDVNVEANTISVTAQNVARFVLEPPAQWWGNGQKVNLVVNGEQAGSYAPQTPIEWKAVDAKLDKFPGRVGPFKNLMRAPFLLVYGNETDARDAARFAEEWQIWADGIAPLKAASNITAADKAKFNLLLFGTRASNPLLREIGDQLPLEITPTGYRMGKTNVAAQQVGLRMVWKSPWNAQRLIGVCSGLWWGEMLPPNHKWDWIPDYIVYGNETEPDPDNTNRAVVAGWFDGNWNLVSKPTAITK